MTDKEQSIQDFEDYAYKKNLLPGSVLYHYAKEGWMAALQWILEPREEPTPTEMVKGLLEKGWTVPKEDPFGWESPDKLFWFPMKKIRSAYRRAFPPKKRITVDVWRHEPSGCVIGPHQGAGDGWDTKGTATFEVPEEE